MADIETNVVISAQIDGLRSGMVAAASSVQAATDAMRAQLAGLGDIAQQAQSQPTAATGQIGNGVGTLQSKAANLAGSMTGSMFQDSAFGSGEASGFALASSPLDNEREAMAEQGYGTKNCSPTRNFRATRRGSTFKRHKSASEPGRA